MDGWEEKKSTMGLRVDGPDETRLWKTLERRKKFHQVEVYDMSFLNIASKLRRCRKIELNSKKNETLSCLKRHPKPK